MAHRRRGALLGILAAGVQEHHLADVLRETVLGAGADLAADLGDLSAAVTAWHRRAAPRRTPSPTWPAPQAAWARWLTGPSGVVPTHGPRRRSLRMAWSCWTWRPRSGATELVGEAALDILPGRTIALDGADVRVGLVEHRQRGAALRTVVWSERDADIGDGAGRLRAALAAMIRAETRRVDYHALYPATVLSQDGAGGRWTCALTPRTSPPQAVPLRAPRREAHHPAGTRVLLGYEGGDPARPSRCSRSSRT